MSHATEPGNVDKTHPNLQDLMAATIKLMARCAMDAQREPALALLKLLEELRKHPDLSRTPAVLACLAEAQSIWLHRVDESARQFTCPELAKKLPGGALH